MFSNAQLQIYAQWSAYLTLFFGAVTALGLILKWGFRFRLVGVTAFMGVLTTGIFALSLALYNRPEIAGAVRYARVFDSGANLVVITVSNQITPTELDATLRQAAADLFSPGRLSQGDDRSLTIRARAILHTKPGLSQVVYLGQAKRSLIARNDERMEVKVYQDKFALLPKSVA